MKHLSADTLEAMRQAILRDPGDPNIPPGPFVGLWLGKIDATGKTPYTNQRYWIKLSEITNTDGDQTTALTIGALDAADPRYLQVTATNLAEQVSGTHLVAEGEFVWGWIRRDKSAPPVVRYFFSHPVPITQFFKIAALSPLTGYALTNISGSPPAPAWADSTTSLVHLGSGCIKVDDAVLASYAFGYWVITSVITRLKAE
jgi:hypothetical protein